MWNVAKGAHFFVAPSRVLNYELQDKGVGGRGWEDAGRVADRTLRGH